MKTSVAIDQYLDALPADRREDLRTLRKLVLRIWPRVREDMAFGMPTFHLNGQPFCAIANQKHFMALYVMHYDLLIAFKNDLKALDTGKSCIRFKRLDDALIDLFDRIIKYTGSQMSSSVHYGRTERPVRNGKTR